MMCTYIRGALNDVHFYQRCFPKGNALCFLGAERVLRSKWRLLVGAALPCARAPWRRQIGATDQERAEQKRREILTVFRATMDKTTSEFAQLTVRRAGEFLTTFSGVAGVSREFFACLQELQVVCLCLYIL